MFILLIKFIITNSDYKYPKKTNKKQVTTVLFFMTKEYFYNRNIFKLEKNNEKFYNQIIIEFLEFNGYEEIAHIFKEEVAHAVLTNQEAFSSLQRPKEKENIQKEKEKKDGSNIAHKETRLSIIKNIKKGNPIDLTLFYNYDYELLFNNKILNYLKRLLILELIQKSEWENAFLILDGKKGIYDKQGTSNISLVSDDTTNSKSENPNNMDESSDIITSHFNTNILNTYKMTIQVNDILRHIIYKTHPDIVKERELTAELINQLIMAQRNKKCSLLEAVNSVGMEILSQRMRLNRPENE